jgi:quercetin dioxygenase-like cupin family protein
MNATAAVKPTADLLSAGAEERFEIRGTQVIVRVAAPSVSVTEHTIPAGFPGPPLHIHPILDEVFVVLEGTLTLQVRDGVHEVGVGETVFARGAIPHTFANRASTPARFLVVGTPGGFHEYFRAIAAGDDELLAAVSERFLYEPVASAVGEGA